LIEIGANRNAMGYFYAVVKKEKSRNGKGCTGCTLCAIMCPEVAIEVYREER
jgi:2-oxoglutarate ferredoxin oxidoreductase subunit delta